MTLVRVSGFIFALFISDGAAHCLSLPLKPQRKHRIINPVAMPIEVDSFTLPVHRSVRRNSTEMIAPTRAYGSTSIQHAGAEKGRGKQLVTISFRYRMEAHQVMTFDLLSVLPQLLPSAIAWVEAQSHRANETGQALDATGLVLARKVEVQHPEVIRTQLVDTLPLPDEHTLRQAALATGLLGPGMVGLTLGYSIFIVRGHMSPRLLSHECRHVYQYETAGSIAAFLPVYLQQIATVGYQAAPLEQDARTHEIDAV